MSVSHLVELVIEANDGAVAGTSAGENIVQVTGSIRRVGEAETKILTLVSLDNRCFVLRAFHLITTWLHAICLYVCVFAHS